MDPASDAYARKDATAAASTSSFQLLPISKTGCPTSTCPQIYVSTAGVTADHETEELAQYRLYKYRFVGISALVCTVVVILNLSAGMCWPWFGPISNKMVRDFGITLDQVNWLGNIEACAYIPVSLLVPIITRRYGIRRCCNLGALALLLSAWIRFSGTARSLSGGRAYCLLLLGQFFASLSQPIFQVLGPPYSEAWFDLKGRTTATMIVSIANPIGGALGQLISPLIGDTRDSILVLGIICTVAAPVVFLIRSAPLTPPTYSGSKPNPSLASLCKAIVGKRSSDVRDDEAHMTVRDRVDFVIICLLFGVLVGATNAFAVLTAQIFEPYGYSDDISGLMGAALLLTGIVAAIITAPLSDRVFTHQLAFSAKILVPPLAGAWLSLIWAVKPHNTQALFVVMTILGICSLSLLPIGLELGCEVTRNADGSAALLWCAGNIFCVIFILVDGALRAGPDGHPPLNMQQSLIFTGSVVMAISSLVFFLRGKQTRKELDRFKHQEQVAGLRVTG